MDSIHGTARNYFLAKVINGGVPEMVVGGPHDGLRYFPEELDGVLYWITELGFITPPAPETPDRARAD